jgi:excisionase family DNA binding protein
MTTPAYRVSAEETTPDVPGEYASALSVQPSEMKLIPPALVTVEEAATFLSIGRSTMFELLKRGEIPSLTIGPRQRRVRVVDLDDFVARRLEAQDGAR